MAAIEVTFTTTTEEIAANPHAAYVKAIQELLEQTISNSTTTIYIQAQVTDRVGNHSLLNQTFEAD
jgi:hypothetical protein